MEGDVCGWYLTGRKGNSGKRCEEYSHVWRLLKSPLSAPLWFQILSRERTKISIVIIQTYKMDDIHSAVIMGNLLLTELINAWASKVKAKGIHSDHTSLSKHVRSKWIWKTEWNGTHYNKTHKEISPEQGWTAPLWHSPGNDIMINLWYGNINCGHKTACKYAGLNTLHGDIQGYITIGDP